MDRWGSHSSCSKQDVRACMADDKRDGVNIGMWPIRHGTEGIPFLVANQDLLPKLSRAMDLKLGREKPKDEDPHV
eukprot:scaffold5_cov331-Pavlova_lutheri.AAC.53